MPVFFLIGAMPVTILEVDAKVFHRLSSQLLRDEAVNRFAEGPGKAQDRSQVIGTRRPAIEGAPRSPPAVLPCWQRTSGRPRRRCEPVGVAGSRPGSRRSGEPRLPRGAHPIRSTNRLAESWRATLRQRLALVPMGTPPRPSCRSARDHGRRGDPGWRAARDGWIEKVAPTAELPSSADEVVDLTDHVVLPGLVNTHHHLYQTLTRVVPGAQDSGLFDWLVTLYPIWAGMTPDHVRVSTRLGLVELALSGCTTAFDHHYLWPNGSTVDDQIEGAGPVGVRFHVSRGSMSLGRSEGGLPLDSVVETNDVILEDSRRVVDLFHDPSAGSMTRVVLAPCSPFSVTSDLMTATAELARELRVGMHTHLAETADEEDFCLSRFDRRPVEYMEDLGWAGPDVWYAHAVHVADDEVRPDGPFGDRSGSCPTSNMRLGLWVGPGVPLSGGRCQGGPGCGRVGIERLVAHDGRGPPGAPAQSSRRLTGHRDWTADDGAPSAGPGDSWWRRCWGETTSEDSHPGRVPTSSLTT